MARPHPVLFRPFLREANEPGDAALVRGALGHLYDFAYLQRHPLAGWLPVEEKSRTAGRRLQQQLLAAIEQLRPAGAPSPSHDWRAYQLLTLRYVEGLSVLAVQGKLALSKSEYYRDHERALVAVTSLLSERRARSPNERLDAYPGGAGLRLSGITAGDPATPQFSPRRPHADVVTSFVGREQDLTALEDLLASSRHVTLTGAGGCGKSRLALRAAASLAADYPDGIAFVELAPLADPAVVETAAAATLGVREEHGRTVVEALRDALAERRVLLVLDNCEHLIDACARLAEALLGACPGLRVLATSREPLLIAGEVVYRVPSLAAPPPGARSAEQVGRYAAAQVFVDRARAAQPGFTLTAENAPLVARVCARLDGIPLALELAAVRTRAFPMAELATHLDESFRLLTAGRRTALPRQRTLRATIDWSFNLLADQERALFRRLAVFSGGWTLEAAEAVCAGDGVEQADVADLLARLVDKSVVTPTPGAGELARYRLLEMLREYAGERLAASGEADTVRRRHAQYIVALAERAELPGPRYSQWVMRLDAEQGNVRAAFGWLRAQGAGDRQARLVAALGWYWMQSGSTSETRAWAEEALAWTAASGVHPLRAGVLYGAGLVAYDLGDLPASRAWLEASLAQWEQLGDRRRTAWALLYVAQLAREGGEFADARALTLRCLELFRALGDAWAEVFTLTRLGLIAVAAGDPEESRRWHGQALAGVRALGDQEGTAAVLGYLGAAARVGGDLSAAGRAFREALLLNRDLGWARGLAERLAPLAGLAALIDQPERAARLLGATAAQLDLGGAGRLLPSTRAAYERDCAAVRARLGEAAFAREAAAGAALPLDAAVAEALAVASATDVIPSATERESSRAQAEQVDAHVACRPTPLPLAPTPMIGREETLQHLAMFFGPDGTRLLTVTGTGGIGKTRVALELAGRLAVRYPDGVALVELAALTDPTLVPHAVAAAAGGREAPRQDPLTGLLQGLQSRQMLLVLDNCEHLLDACATLVDRLLRACPGLTVLATSREPLGLPAEVRFPLAPLRIPDPGEQLSLDALARVEAVQLFLARASAGQPGFALNEQNAASVAALCRYLDGIPLAIELAAARLAAVPVSELAARLDQCFRLLTTGNRAALPRQRTLRATIDWSYDLLSPEERVLFRGLSVFAGGWTLEAAEAVFQAPGQAAGDVLALITRLVDKSLVTVDLPGPRSATPQYRYRLLETLRQYAHERLTATGEANSAQERHAAYYLDLLEDTLPGLRHRDQAGVLAMLDCELANLRQALSWFERHGPLGQALQLAGGLGQYWVLRGHLREGYAYLERLLSLPYGERASVARARALRWHAAFVYFAGDEARCRALGEQSLALWRELDDLPGLVDVLDGLGVVYRDLGNYAVARAYVEEALLLHRRLGDAPGGAVSLDNLGAIAQAAGDYAAARGYFDESLALLRPHGSRSELAWALHHLGSLALDLGDAELARAVLAECLQVRRAINERPALVRTLTLCAALEAHQGRHPRAACLAGAASTLAAALALRLETQERTMLDQAVARSRQALQGLRFATASAQGERMTLDQAVTYALSGLASPHDPDHAAVAGLHGTPSLPLTRREREVLAYLCRGCSNREVAADLVISERTAASHVEHILAKLELASRSQVAVWAVRHGLVGDMLPHDAQRR